MTLLSLARMWRLPYAAAALLVALALGVIFRDAQILLPSADGIRSMRQMIVALTPPLASVILLDQAPEMTATTPRGRTLLRCLGAAVCLCTLAAQVPTWSRVTHATAATTLYDVFATCAFLAVSVWATKRFGLPGLAFASLISLAWLLAGNTLAAALGFFYEWSQFTDTAPSITAWAATGAAFAAAVFAAWHQPARAAC